MHKYRVAYRQTKRGSAFTESLIEARHIISTAAMRMQDPAVWKGLVAEVDSGPVDRSLLG